ncbi:hypothetical protein [Candidatus Vesicomyidisocius calyptogenae]|uniref:Uncharacterized protein n=1 Tax=Vesicomyosocius okutanii subsp. Calyptogena okutanii (strain HA) TaxID=412965 RepID=A5CX34_VESOH|nr:hypothetical protein [Candidatus Vesicomyosocius okutanii]BAF61482.1 hypothetical protein COSY_0357 [Candidatus Vesicomyosocius okutanii]
MLESIDYYSKKSKKKLKLKCWLLLILVSNVGIFWYLNQKDNIKKAKEVPALIVINHGEKEQKEVVSTVIINDYLLLNSGFNRNIINSKELDEIIYNYTNKLQ